MAPKFLGGATPGMESEFFPYQSGKKLYPGKDIYVQLNPDYDAAWFIRGFIFSWLGRYEQAVISYGQAVKINPDNYAPWYNIAINYARQNDLDSTIKNLKQAFSLNAELRENAKTDSAFDAFREDQRFQDLMKE